jgi:hypothetical protein
MLVALLQLLPAARASAASPQAGAGQDGLSPAPGPTTRPLWTGVPWGFYTNYPDFSDPSITNQMLTDVMATPEGRQNVEQQLVNMASRNATLWRIFPQFQDVLAGPATVNTSGIAVLTQALDMAHKHGIQVTVTGLSDFVPARNPAWLNRLGEAEDSESLITAASAVWWGALATAWKGHPAVFSFDLMNEPVWEGGPKPGPPKPGANPWAAGCMGAVNDSKCFDFQHNRHWQHTWTTWVHANFTGGDDAALRAAWPDFPLSAQDTWQHPQVPKPVGFAKPAPAAAPRVANYRAHLFAMQRSWADSLVKSIKAVDGSRLVSVGELFPAGCRPYSDLLDYYSVHLYPPGDINSTDMLRTHFVQQMAELPSDEKPVFVEEFFPLGLNPAISVTEYMDLFIEVVSPRARAYTTYFCPTNAGIMQQYCEDWLALIQSYASNATSASDPQWRGTEPLTTVPTAALKTDEHHHHHNQLQNHHPRRHDNRRPRPRPRSSPVGKALQSAALTGEPEAVTFDRVLQAGVPAGLPSRSSLPSSANAMINIMDYNVSANGSKDISWALDLIGTQYPASDGGRTVLLPPGTYLIYPYPKLNETVYSVPTHISLSFARGAKMCASGITRVYIGGVVEADYTQQIFCSPLAQTPVTLSSNGTLARAEISDGFASGHGFEPGDRFFVQGSSPAYDGGWTVTALDEHNKCAFYFQLLHDPQGGDPGKSATLSIASFYFVAETFPGQSLFRAMGGEQEWVSPDWWGAAGNNVWEDSTVAVQSAFDAAGGIMLMGSYRVSRVSLEGSRTLEGRGGRSDVLQMLHFASCPLLLLTCCATQFTTF